MPLTLPELPYEHAALADSGMCQETVETHHLRHHNAYVQTGNGLLEGTEWADKSVEEIVAGTYQHGAVAQSAIFNNLAQHWNHCLFWESMAPGGVACPSRLSERLEKEFGSFDNFKQEFKKAGLTQFGSGWAWLVETADGALKVTKTENGVNPLCTNDTALLGCDVWEHSYYLDFKNKRPDYLDNFLTNLVNWEEVDSRLKG